MSIDPEILMQTTCPIEMLCEHDDTFLWPFFWIDGAVVGNRCCTDCGARLETKIAVDGVEHEYR